MNGDIDMIVTKSISRFARNTLDTLKYVRMLKEKGIAVFFEEENINTLTMDGELRLVILSSVAQQEVENISANVKKGLKMKMQRGELVGFQGCLGYDYHPEDKTITVNEEEAEMVRFIFESYAGGEMTTPKIENALYEMGWRNYKGGRIDRGVIQHIITNPKYKGYYVGNKVKVIDMFTKKQAFLPEEEWVMYKDEEKVPAIVSEELWERANCIYKMRGDIIKNRRSSFKTDNLFTGKIICEADGCAYWLKARSDRNGNNNSRWVCSHKLKAGTGNCKSFAIMERELLDILASVLREICGGFDEVVERFVRLYEKSAQSVDYDGEMEKIREEIRKVEQKKDKLLEYNLDGKISDKEFLRRNDSLNHSLEQLEKAAEELEAQKEDDRVKLEEIYRLKKNLKGLDAITAEDFTQSIINLFIDRIYAEPVDERQMKLKIVLNTGDTRNRVYEKQTCGGGKDGVRSGHTMKKMIEAQEKMMAEKNQG